MLPMYILLVYHTVNFFSSFEIWLCSGENIVISFHRYPEFYLIILVIFYIDFYIFGAII